MYAIWDLKTENWLLHVANYSEGELRIVHLFDSEGQADLYLSHNGICKEGCCHEIRSVTITERSE